MSGDDLLKLLGLGVEEAPVQACLARLARTMQPELDPDDPDDLVDWVTINELGLEFGFEDEANVRAWDIDLRRAGRLLLTQLYFYGDTPTTQPFSFALPFGLSFADDRARVRAKLRAFEATRRSFLRDAWRLPAFGVTVAYAGHGPIESIFCYVPYAPWPPESARAAVLVGVTPEMFVRLFGLRWSKPELRLGLAMFGLDRRLAEVRSEKMVDLRRSDGLELYFAQGRRIAIADQRFPRSLVFAAVTFLAERELDARQWQGPLPYGLVFGDTQADLLRKVPGTPSERTDSNLCGIVEWHFDHFSLSVLYSNLENRLLRVTLMAPGYS